MTTSLPIDIKDFRYTTPLHLRWNDFDMLGHINNVIYFEYFQIGRVDYMRKMSKKWDWHKNTFVIANISCDFIKEMRVNVLNPELRLRVLKIGNKSFDIEYLITSQKKDGTLVFHALGKSTQVLLDIVEKMSVKIPEWLKQEILEYEPSL